MIKKLELKRLTDDTFYIEYYAPPLGWEERSFPNAVEMVTFLVKRFLGHKEPDDFQYFIARLKATEDYENEMGRH